MSLVARTAPAAAVTLARAPYLQLLGRESVTIAWRTDASAQCAVAIGSLAGGRAVVAGGVGTACAVAVAGLVPGTEYAYAPLADGTALAAEVVFRTDDPSRRFSFLVLGDSGSGLAPQYAVRDRMLASPVDFLVHTGDMIYDAGVAADYDPKFFTPYTELLRRVVFWPCLGNHDIQTSLGAPWREAFYTPANNLAGTENYYSFDHGNAHVVVLDSNASLAPGSPQYAFLDADLASSTATWKFVSFHHTIYSSGSHGSDLALQANLVPLFDLRGVDMVFMGHDHDYERTHPLFANQVVAPGVGTVYVTTGGGGESARPVGSSAFTAYAEAAFHFTRVSIDGGGLLLQMIRRDGVIRDTFALVKGIPPPAPQCGDDLVNQSGEQCDGADHTVCRGGCRADCTCAPVCGDGLVNQPGEVCDGASDGACPGLCRADCACGDPALFVTLPAVADTYIEAGTQATWDHGAAAHLDVDQKPAGIAYLKFDLSGIPVAVAHATLTLACTNTSVDGGAVYPVGTASWVEGDRTGADTTSAGGPGLKWSEVDTNADGAIDAHDTSPYVPLLGRPAGTLDAVTAGQAAAVDVTGAFQQGPRLYSIALRNDSSDGATYVSRQGGTASQRPRLRLELGGPLPTTTSTSSTTSTTRVMTTTSSTSTSRTTSSSTSTSSTTSTSSSTVPPIVLTAAATADVTVNEKTPGTNLGSGTRLDVDGHAGKRKRTFVRVAVTGIGTRVVTSVRLRLHVLAVGGGEGGRVHRITSCGWNELGVTWTTQPAIDGPVLATLGTVAVGSTVDFDVTGAVARDGDYCFALESGVLGSVSYDAREAGAQGPRLVVQVAP